MMFFRSMMVTFLALALLAPALPALASGPMQRAELALVKSRSAYYAKSYDEAESLAREAIKDNPKLADAHAVLGWSLFKKNQFADAVTSMRKALELDARRTDLFFDIGVGYLRMNQYDQAREWLEKAVAADKAAVSHYYLGLAYFLAEKCTPAVEHLETARKQDARFTQGTLFYKGLCLRKDGDVNEGNDALTLAIEVDERSDIADAARRVLAGSMSQDPSTKPFYGLWFVGAYYDSNVTLEPSLVGNTSASTGSNTIGGIYRDVFAGNFSERSDAKMLASLLLGGTLVEKNGHAFRLSGSFYFTTYAEGDLRDNFSFFYGDFVPEYRFTMGRLIFALPYRFGASFLRINFKPFSFTNRLEPSVASAWNDWAMTSFRVSGGIDLYQGIEGDIPPYADRDAGVLEPTLTQYFAMGSERYTVGFGYRGGFYFTGILDNTSVEADATQPAATKGNDWNNQLHAGHLHFNLRPHDVITLRFGGEAGRRIFKNSLQNPLAFPDSQRDPATGEVLPGVEGPTRNDTPINANAEVRFNLLRSSATIYISLQTAYTRNFSTVDLYDFERWLAGGGFGGSF